MNRAARLGSSLLAGLMFGVGLVVSGMTNPSKVLGFLDVFGAWDPSLAFVMIGAIGVYLVAYRWSRRLPAPLLGDHFTQAASSVIDFKLLGGAALFGVGWGISGYCPGPSLVALASFGPKVIVFVAALAIGMFATGQLERRLER